MNQQQNKGCLYPSMKVSLFILFLFAVSFLGFKYIDHPSAKTYSVSHTSNDWQRELDTLGVVQRSIGYALTRQESDAFQSAIARMQQRIIEQVAPQIAADSVKPNNNKQK